MRSSIANSLIQYYFYKSAPAIKIKDLTVTELAACNWLLLSVIRPALVVRNLELQTGCVAWFLVVLKAVAVNFALALCVEIVMLEKPNYILSKRATRPVYIWKYKYGWMPSARTRVNSHLRPYETSPSPAIQDISVSGWDLYMQYFVYTRTSLTSMYHLPIRIAIPTPPCPTFNRNS